MQDWEQAVALLHAGQHQPLLRQIAELRAAGKVIYPPQARIFYALELTPMEQVKVVILGQDPYHGPGQAQGLAFSVPESVTAPPSLRNIFKEVQQDVYAGEKKNFSNNLSRWARQGVLLLNTALTVENGKAGSHSRIGWTAITDDIIKTLSEQRKHLVFMLWGRHAQDKKALISADHHLLLESVHPSPLSARRGFFGCRHFSQANDYLIQHGYEPIVW